jgi:signal peptidase I
LKIIQKGTILADVETQKKSEGTISETIKIIAQALLLAVVVRTLLFQPFSIPSGSMMPTLLVGDYLFVSKMSYGYSKYSIPFSPNLFSGRIWSSEPKRGDIAVFKLPSNPDVDYVKRVIGLPGDRIQMKNGTLYINDKPVKRKLTGEFTPEGRYSRNTRVPVYTETLPNGISYKTLDLIPNGEADNTRVFEVPPKHYFMMGDNRDNSLDSRFDVGFVPLENFVGRAKVLFFSVSGGASPWQFWRWPSTLRAGRLFTGL